MLAWVHQALASERDLLVALLSTGQEPQQKPGAAANGKGQDAEQAALSSTTAMLDRIFESICRPLKVCAVLMLPSRMHGGRSLGACLAQTLLLVVQVCTEVVLLSSAPHDSAPAAQ